jgi:hypothetical protein
MNRATAVLAACLMMGTTACKDFLDVNNNPNAPDKTATINYLPPMMHWLAQSEQLDGRFIGRYAQMWHVPPATQTATPDNWARHGYDPTSDNAAQLYRDVYWSFGHNLGDMMRQAEQEQRWDLLGIGQVLRAWGWLKLTVMHGEIIIEEAFTPDKFRFAFDTQEEAYDEIFRLLDLAIGNLARTDGNISASYIAPGDRMFNGDRARWTKFAWGLKAMALNHFSNKAAEYNPQAVIDAVDKSFAGNAEEALFPFANISATPTDDRSFWAVERGNLGSYRQTEFIVGLMNGTQYPGAVDPRLTRMLAPDSTGAYRGMNINQGFSSVTRERPFNLWGYAGTGTPASGTPGRYLFDYRPRYPVMTYAQVQFIKAEAAMRRGDVGTARDAYLKGISAHIDFVNARNAEIGRTDIPAITASEKQAFLDHPSINPPTLGLSHIMGQKFIAQFGWAFLEAWMDQRRYHYTDIDPRTGTQVFRGYAFPTNWYPDNSGRPVQRVRPRFNSDYVWNREELAKIGGLALDYHTKPMWITEP